MIKKPTLLSTILLVYALGLWSCSKDDENNIINDPPVDSIAELNLPDTLFNYANI